MLTQFSEASPTGFAGPRHDPDSEVVPGVRWGRPEWVPSPAYWADVAAQASDDKDGFVSRDVPLAVEVGFCLLGGFGITAEMNHAIHDRLLDEGIFQPGRRPTVEVVEKLLRAPVVLNSRLVRYRFPRQRALRLANALATLEDNPPAMESVHQFRQDLMRIPGIGPKTASWIARNWLGSDEVAILDIHILRAGFLMGLFERSVKLPRDYEVLEQRFLAFCAALGVRPSLMDAVMWTEMRILGRGPV